MGINKLFPLLEEYNIPQRINISELANKTVAIDAYGWLYKGLYAVAHELVTGQLTVGHIDYCIKCVKLLLSHGIKPILVFDGQQLPAKADTEEKRQADREAAREQANEFLRQGNFNEARKYQQRCVDVTHEMALQLIKRCREMNVDCIVAPYETDAQLAFLNKIGMAEYVVTEDTDLILFGCEKILFKLNISASTGKLVDIGRLHLAMGCAKAIFTMDKFRLMCILSGCDYVDSLLGIGLKTARKCVLANKEADLMRVVDKMPLYLDNRTLRITEAYKTNVQKARATFLHMVVYDPRLRKQVRLNEIEDLGTNIEYCSEAGEILDDAEKALDLAVGNLNPFTFVEVDNWHPNEAQQSILWFQKSATISPSYKKTHERFDDDDDDDNDNDVDALYKYKVFGNVAKEDVLDHYYNLR